MRVIEDVRKALQDFVAPELRAMNARFDAIEHRCNAIDQRWITMEKISEIRHNELLAQFESVKASLAFDKRLERLENERREPRTTEKAS